MPRTKNAGTTLEIMFRQYVWRKRLKNYRIKNNIIGKLDICFAKQKIAVFIDGYLWHGCPKYFIAPKSHKSY